MKDVEIVFSTGSLSETMALGKALGALLEAGDVVGLVGELGSGKTWFTKGLALGLGVHDDMVVTSPSFALIQEYEGRCPVFHMDVYRLQHLSEFLSAGLEEYFFEEGVVVMEWADRWSEMMPPHTFWVRLAISLAYHELKEGEVPGSQRCGGGRQITLSGSHPRSVAILEELAKGLVPGIRACKDDRRALNHSC